MLINIIAHIRVLHMPLDDMSFVLYFYDIASRFEENILRRYLA